ncbi:putative bifunctional diguanylate cyclase/phosphodiesterase [Cryptosporangium sp. NPDC051539]|uniref:putative bifunctional diguanylate cyclase/phosphodiesterase n=1 Tax=Cryptosporangium sp. NPDC051539 TaxID=3363962 RepID=UPI00379E6494
MTRPRPDESRARVPVWWIVAALALIVLLPALTLPLPGRGAVLPSVLNLGVALWAAREHVRARRGSAGRERLLRGLGVLAMVPWLAYWVVRTLQLGLEGSEARPPAILAVPALLALLIALIALLAGPDAPASVAGKLRMAFDGVIVALSTAGVAWLLVLRPAVEQVRVAERGPAPGAALLALSGGLILVGSVGVLLAFGNESRRWTTVESIALGIALLAVSTFATMVLRLNGVGSPFTLVGGLTAVAGLVIGQAARLPIPEGHQRLWNPLGTSAQVLPFVPVTVLLGVAAYRRYHGDPTDPTLVTLGVLVALAMLARQGLALRLNTQLASQLDRQRDYLVHQAFHDPLTGLANRTLFADRLAELLDGGKPALLLVDLDGFKKVNDTRGHAAGDELLVATAARLEACVRKADTVARLGGDEFAVLLPNAGGGPAAVVAVADAVLDRLAEPVALIGGSPVSVRASIGIALAEDGSTAETLLRDADMALYDAKERGRNRYRIADQELSTATLARLRLEEELRRGLDAGQFEVHYQPIVELASARAIAVEALLRWRHPARGLLAPGAFLDVAESIGLLPRLDQWVLTQACGQITGWREIAPEFVVSVNISGAHLSDPALVDQVSATMADSGVSAGALMLEVTETALVADLALAACTLGKLADLGVRIALDDFGTGYSSLTYLRTLPIHTLKIDRSFVRDLDGNPTDEAVTRAILGLADTLGLRPVAEGVEGVSQADRLRALRCGHAQGYLFGKPMPAEEITDLLDVRT